MNLTTVETTTSFLTHIYLICYLQRQVIYLHLFSVRRTTDKVHKEFMKFLEETEIELRMRV